MKLKLVKPCFQCKRMARLDDMFDRLCPSCMQISLYASEANAFWFRQMIDQGIDSRMANRIIICAMERDRRGCDND